MLPTSVSALNLVLDWESPRFLAGLAHERQHKSRVHPG